MPGMSGYEVCKRVAEMYPSQTIPIIMLSAKSTEQDIIKGLDSGVHDYIHKPFQAGELLARIKTQLHLMDTWNLELEAVATSALLARILPSSVIQRLKDGVSPIADSHDSTTILFSDIVSFTSVAAILDTRDVVLLLNEMFTLFDALVDKHGIYKVETIGDAYMAASGHDGKQDHCQRAFRMACDMVEAVRGMHFNEKVTAELGMTHPHIRVGLHSGPTYTGVVGQKCPRYCFFGDTVNIAARMETTGAPMCIHMSHAFYTKLGMDLTNSVQSGFQGQVRKRPCTLVKGKGCMITYLASVFPETELPPEEVLSLGSSVGEMLPLDVHTSDPGNPASSGHAARAVTMLPVSDWVPTVKPSEVANVNTSSSVKTACEEDLGLVVPGSVVVNTLQRAENVGLETKFDYSEMAQVMRQVLAEHSQLLTPFKNDLAGEVHSALEEAMADRGSPLRLLEESGAKIFSASASLKAFIKDAKVAMRSTPQERSFAKSKSPSSKRPLDKPSPPPRSGAALSVSPTKARVSAADFSRSDGTSRSSRSPGADFSSRLHKDGEWNSGGVSGGSRQRMHRAERDGEALQESAREAPAKISNRSSSPPSKDPYKRSSRISKVDLFRANKEKQARSLQEGAGNITVPLRSNSESDSTGRTLDAVSHGSKTSTEAIRNIKWSDRFLSEELSGRKLSGGSWNSAPERVGNGGSGDNTERAWGRSISQRKSCETPPETWRSNLGCDTDGRSGAEKHAARAGQSGIRGRHSPSPERATQRKGKSVPPRCRGGERNTPTTSVRSSLHASIPKFLQFIGLEHLTEDILRIRLSWEEFLNLDQVQLEDIGITNRSTQIRFLRAIQEYLNYAN